MNRCKVTFVSSRVASGGRRRRNPRGEGSRLRRDILDAASEILETTGSEEAVTLRAVARAVGIAAPSIYAHFADREAILDQLVAEGFAEFTAGLQAAIAPYGDPVERLLMGCRAYLAYAAEHPRRYRTLFHHPDIRNRGREVDAESLAQGAAALNVLVEGIADCARAGRSTSQDHFTDAVAVWVALHGLASLIAETPATFPWPDQLLTAIVTRLAQIDTAGLPLRE
jgi:AcrR family transcriptional regulator